MATGSTSNILRSNTNKRPRLTPSSFGPGLAPWTKMCALSSRTVPPSSDEHEVSIARRLAELGVATAPDEVQELRSAYDALRAWMRIADELGADDDAMN